MRHILTDSGPADRAAAHWLRLIRGEDARRTEASTLVLAMLERQKTEDWSRRELLEKAGLPAGTFYRALAGHCDLDSWLPRLRTAATRLGI